MNDHCVMCGQIVKKAAYFIDRDGETYGPSLCEYHAKRVIRTYRSKV